MHVSSESQHANIFTNDLAYDVFAFHQKFLIYLNYFVVEGLELVAKYAE